MHFRGFLATKSHYVFTMNCQYRFTMNFQFLYKKISLCLHNEYSRVFTMKFRYVCKINLHCFFTKNLHYIFTMNIYMTFAIQLRHKYYPLIPPPIRIHMTKARQAPMVSVEWDSVPVLQSILNNNIAFKSP